MMKRLTIVVLVLVGAGVLVGCADGSPAAKKQAVDSARVLVDERVDVVEKQFNDISVMMDNGLKAESTNELEQ